MEAVKTLSPELDEKWLVCVGRKAIVADEDGALTQMHPQSNEGCLIFNTSEEARAFSEDVKEQYSERRQKVIKVRQVKDCCNYGYMIKAKDKIEPGYFFEALFKKFEFRRNDVEAKAAAKDFINGDLMRRKEQFAKLIKRAKNMRIELGISHPITI